MLSVLVHEDLEELVFPDDLRRVVYGRDKPIRQFLFFDVPSVLHHYIKRLDEAEEEEEDKEPSDRRHGRPPSLRVLSIGANLGSMDTQLVNEAILRSRVETRRYYDLPWRLSESHSRASTDFMMLSLCRLFSRPPDHFSALRKVRLNAECLNTRLDVVAAPHLSSVGKSNKKAGQAAVQLMAGLAYSCPALEILDLRKVLRNLLLV